MKGTDDRTGRDAWPEMARVLESWGLSVPPVPAPLRPSLREVGPKCWTTRDGITGFDMYAWAMTDAEQVLIGDVCDYVAVSHAGHGVNSYAITYHLVYRGLALFVQEGWGGAYMDNHTQAASVADMFERCRDLVDRWEKRPPDADPTRRLLCLDNRLRGTSACGWAPVDQPQSDKPGGTSAPAAATADGRIPEGQPGAGTPLQRFLRRYTIGPGKAFEQAKRLLTDTAP